MALKKEFKLDMFELLTALDKRDFKFYSTLTDEQKKSFAGIVAMRWMSSAPYSDVMDEIFHILVVNDSANQHFWNSEITKHPELQYLMLACCGTGSTKIPSRAPHWAKSKHAWIKGPATKKRKNKSMQILSDFYPTANTEELQMFFNMNDADDIIGIAKMMGRQDEQIKELKKELKGLGK